MSALEKRYVKETFKENEMKQTNGKDSNTY